MLKKTLSLQAYNVQYALHLDNRHIIIDLTPAFCQHSQFFLIRFKWLHFGEL